MLKTIHLKSILHALCILCASVFLTACQIESDTKSELAQIKERGVLRVGTINNQLSYFIGPNGPTGLDYELAKRFADELGVKLEIKPSYQVTGLFPALERNEVDLIAAGLTHTDERLKDFRAGPAYYYVSQQLVYKKGNYRPRNLKQLVTEIKDKNKSFKIVESEHFIQTLNQIKQDNPDLTWELTKNGDASTLLQQVEEGSLDFTLVDSVDLALAQRLHPNLNKALELSEDQSVSWFIRQEQDESLYALMIEFFGDLSQSGELAKLEEKYFGHIQSFDYVDTRAFIRSLESKLPKYQKLFQKYSKDFDWRLIAALSYQESHWNPYATSPTGVRGMMMLTLPTAQSVNVKDRLNPRESIRGGVEYLDKIVERVPDSIPKHEKIWFALASYNIGFGHMMDARRLTESQGGDPNSWTDVKERLPMLEQSRYFKQLRYGYARGREAQSYVENIRRYYQSILAYLDENPAQEVEDTDEDFQVIDQILPELEQTDEVEAAPLQSDDASKASTSEPSEASPEAAKAKSEAEAEEKLSAPTDANTSSDAKTSDPDAKAEEKSSMDKKSTTQK